MVGAVIKAKYGDFVEITTSSLTTGPVFLIIIGVIVAIVGFLGCCGAYKENYCMVTTVSAMWKGEGGGGALSKSPRCIRSKWCSLGWNVIHFMKREAP